MSASCSKVWEVHTGGMPTNPDYAKLYGTENTPLKVGNLLYTCTAKNVIVALDAATGKPVWRVDPQVPDEWIPYTTACRGVAYYQVPGAAPERSAPSRIIEGTLDFRLIEVDALTGKRCTEFNGTGQQDTKIGMGWVFPGSRRSTRRRRSCAGSSSSGTRCSTDSAAARHRA